MDREPFGMAAAAKAAREALADYYGTACACGMPAAMKDLIRAEELSDEEAIEEALQLNLL
jgi:hypothetical protein